MHNVSCVFLSQSHINTDRNQTGHSNQNIIISIQENQFENTVCKNGSHLVSALMWYLLLPRPIQGLRPANERRRYFVVTYLIGWAQAWIRPAYRSLCSSRICWTTHTCWGSSTCWRHRHHSNLRHGNHGDGSGRGWHLVPGLQYQALYIAGILGNGWLMRIVDHSLCHAD